MPPRQERSNRRKVPWLDWRGGIAYVYWYDPDARRVSSRSLGTSDAGEAQARYAAFLTEGRPLHRPASVRPTGLTVGAVLDFYEREHVRKKVVDKERAEDVLANLRTHFGHRLVTEVDIPLGREYVDLRGMGAIGGKGRGGVPMAGSPATCRRELSVLIAAVNHCLRWGHLPSEGLRRDAQGNVQLVELPPDSEPATRWLRRPGEMQALRAACGETGRLRWWFEIAYYTASRRDAIETLTKFQVDLERGRIHLAKPGEPKTTKRRPTVPIDPLLRPWLAAALEASDNEYVLGSPQPVYRAFKAACDRAGLGADVHPHVTRHSRATHLLQDGVSLFAVANLLGDTTSTVERVYGQHSVDFMAEVLSNGKAGEDGRP